MLPGAHEPFPISSSVSHALSADDEAMRRVAAGDSDALAALFDRHKVRLFGFICHLVNERALAEDLLGETFLRVHRSRAAYRVGSGFTAWLYTIARNLALGELRRRSSWLRFHRRFSRETSLVAEWGIESDGTEAWETGEQVRAALARLPEEQRSAIVLKEYLELDYAEIGRVLGCTEQAARARTYRARQALRVLLKDWWEG